MKWYFVIPWYGTSIPGGAEAECRGVVTHLRRSGIEVEVLTTTIKDFMSDWSHNFYEPGTYDEEECTARDTSSHPSSTSGISIIAQRRCHKTYTDYS